MMISGEDVFTLLSAHNSHTRQQHKAFIFQIRAGLTHITVSIG